MQGVRCGIHEHSINKHAKLNIPKNNIKNLMKSVHVEYLTYLILNQRKLDAHDTPTVTHVAW